MIGTFVVLFYTVYGGMWSVAFTDFLQMGIIIAGLIAVAVVASNMAGGVGHVVSFAQSRDLFHVFPEMTLHGWLFWCHDHDDRVDSAAGRFPARDERRG